MEKRKITFLSSHRSFESEPSTSKIIKGADESKDSQIPLFRWI